MLPKNKIKPVDKWLGDINPPRNRKHPNSRSFTLGGAAIGDTSQGIIAYTWEAWTDGTSVFLKRQDRARPDTVLTDKGITDVSVAFDRNMNLVIAYQAGVNSKLWVSRGGSLIGDIKASIRSGKNPRVALDDNRVINAGTSDVIFAYINNLYLCCRYQREDYAVEHQLYNIDDKTALYRIGMGKDNRFLFFLQKQITKEG